MKTNTCIIYVFFSWTPGQIHALPVSAISFVVQDNKINIIKLYHTWLYLLCGLENVG